MRLKRPPRPLRTSAPVKFVRPGDLVYANRRSDQRSRFANPGSVGCGQVGDVYRQQVQGRSSRHWAAVPSKHRVQLTQTPAPASASPRPRIPRPISYERAVTRDAFKDLRRLLKSYQSYYNEVRTHLSLDENAPVLRIVQALRRAGSLQVQLSVNYTINKFGFPSGNGHAPFTCRREKLGSSPR